MFRLLNIRRLRRLCSRLRWPARRRSRPKVVIKKFGNSGHRPARLDRSSLLNGSASAVHPNAGDPERPVRVATFNAALFSMAPVVPKAGGPTRSPSFDFDSREGLVSARLSGEINVVDSLRAKSMNDRPRGILKQSPLHPGSLAAGLNDHATQQRFARSKLRVSINLPDNEISLLRSRQLSFADEGREPPSSSSSSSSSSNGSASAAIGRILRGKAPARNSSSTSSRRIGAEEALSYRSTRSVLEVLRELDADILALQDVKAVEEKDMKPLSDLAAALGMNYVFAESWAPEYGNAVLSKWPIKRWKTQKIFDDTDFRNVLKATIEVPRLGEIDFYCTHLDHLDENWRMKQIGAIIRSTESPHILAGALNSLDETDYSPERWSDIVKYYEEMGKPTPKAEVMRFLKCKQYTDAKDFAGECEPVVMIAKGQSVQGTCKYGTRVDYIMASPDSPFRFAPGSYTVLSSKGTSDHHIVKVDLVKSDIGQDGVGHDKTPNNGSAPKKRRKQQQQQPRVVKITNPSLHQSNGVWRNTVTQNYLHTGKL